MNPMGTSLAASFWILSALASLMPCRCKCSTGGGGGGGDECHEMVRVTQVG